MKKIRFHYPLRVIAVFIILFFIGAVGTAVRAVPAQNPQQAWLQYKTPEEAGFSSEKILAAKQVYDKMQAAAFMVVYKGNVLISWGDVIRRYWCHSARKSLMSAVYGTHRDDGTINLEKTLEELGIDDISPLSKEEKQATIRDLLKARSGVYHPAAAETSQMKASRPPRGSHKRDTFWYYNNWDFNVLCTILEHETKTDFFVDFKKRIADPIGMEDFRLIDGVHSVEPENSIHAAYPFKLSARDLARFGQLFLREGKWNDRQVISQAWIKESTTTYSCAGPNSGYGYLWWIFHDFDDVGGMYAALGVGTQVAAVLPGADMVIVQRVDTYQGKNQPPNRDLIRMILAAKAADPKPNPELIPLQNTPSYQRPTLITLKPKEWGKYYREYQVGETKYVIKESHGLQVAEEIDGPSFQLLPVSKTHFVAEDIETYVLFELDKKGTPMSLIVLPSTETVDFCADILKRGAGPAIKAYQEKCKLPGAAPTFTEEELNLLGLGLLDAKKITAAIEVLKWNMESHPQSAKVYNSLGEAYMKNGDREQAIANYKKALELEPGNKTAAERLKELEAIK